MTAVAAPAMGHWGTGARAPSTFNDFIFSSLWSKSESQLSEYCVVCEIGWCRCQQLTALSISTASVTKLLVIEQLPHLAMKSAVSAPWHNFHLCPSSQQLLVTQLNDSKSRYLTVQVSRASSATTPWSVITARFSSSPRATVATAAHALASTCRLSDLSRLTSSSRPPTRLRTSSAESFTAHRHCVHSNKTPHRHWQIHPFIHLFTRTNDQCTVEQ